MWKNKIQIRAKLIPQRSVIYGALRGSVNIQSHMEGDVVMLGKVGIIQQIPDNSVYAVDGSHPLSDCGYLVFFKI